MAPRPGAVDILSSPSLDTEAASQQLLAEASSPILRPTAAPITISTAAQHGARLLNAARALPKSAATAPVRTGEAGELHKLGQLKSTKLRKPGKLPRASLAGLVSESSQRTARGKQMYDIHPSPQKKRSSLPAQIAALEDEEDDFVPETSQVQPDDDAPVDIPESLDVSVPKEAFGDDDIVETPTSPVAPVEEEAFALEKRRDRLRKSGNSMASRASEASIAEVQEDVHEESTVAPKKRLGRPRKSGDSAAPRPSDACSADVNERFPEDVVREIGEQTQQPAVAAKPKRKGRPDRDIHTNPNGEASNGVRPTKKVKKLKGPKMVSPDEPELEDGVLAPMVTPCQDAQEEVHEDARQESRQVRRQERRQDAQARRDSQPPVQIPIRSTGLRSTRPQAEPAIELEFSRSGVPATAIERKGKAAQRIAGETRTAMTATTPNPVERKKTSRTIQITFPESAQAAEAADADDMKAAQAPAEPEADDRPNEDRLEADGLASDHAEADADAGTNGQKKEQNESVDGPDGQHIGHVGGESAEVLALDTVFSSLNAEEPSEVCSIGLARKINRRCDRSHVELSREECSLHDITTCKNDLIHLLASVGASIQEDSRLDFKHDAYASLFRALTWVLKAMYDKLHEQEGDPVRSYKAMQILYPFIREMLRFKDTIYAWKVRYTQGDGLIKNVNSNLIAPLRTVEKWFKRQLGVLLNAEKDRLTRLKAQQQREKQEQESITKEEALRCARERRKRWQNLHIARMQYEPDPHRRRQLRFVEPPDAAETDANGNQFERVPFFGERSVPPPSLSSTTKSREWTSEQETVLLDALQSSASLERIFGRHCGPGGALRDFSVSDLAVKLAWVRSAWAQLSHQHGWDLPEWVKKIPVLP